MWGKNNGAKNTELSDYDAFAPQLLGFSKARTQIPLDSQQIIPQTIQKFKYLYK